MGGMSTQTITEFLEARIAEDEAVARECTDSGKWSAKRNQEALEWYVDSEEFGVLVITGYVGNSDSRPNAEHIARHDPSRVLAECAAKRAIIALADEVADLDSSLMSEGGGWRWETDKKILRTIAAVYADHADYQQEWAL